MAHLKDKRRREKDHKNCHLFLLSSLMSFLFMFDFISHSLLSFRFVMSNKKFYADDEKSKLIARNSTTTKKKIRKSSKILNKSFVEKKIVKSEPNLEEAAMNIKRFELERSSTPNTVNICEHCKHNHAQVNCQRFFQKFFN